MVFIRVKFHRFAVFEAAVTAKLCVTNHRLQQNNYIAMAWHFERRMRIFEGGILGYQISVP